jgi:hypothetical protein
MPPIHRKPPRGSFPLLVCVVCLAVAGGLSACGSRGIPAIPKARSNLVSILQDDALLHGVPAELLGAAHSLGVQVVRTNVFWYSIAPEPTSATEPDFDAANPSAYPVAGWQIYDEIDRLAAADGVRMLFTLTGAPPLWAAGSGMPHTRNCPCSQWRPSAALFGAFVHAVGERYSGPYIPPGSTTPLPRISFWSIWNEPNYGPDLAPQATDHSRVEVSPNLYRGLLDAAWKGLESSGHTPAADTILIGDTAPRGETGAGYPGNFSGTVPLVFIRGLYCVGGKLRPLRGAAATALGCPATTAGSARFVAGNPALFDASGWADHPYPDSLAPTIRTTFEPDYADFAALGNLERTLDRAAAAYGRRPRLPIYSTEFGYRTDPPTQFGLPTGVAARYLNESEYLSWRSRRIRSYDQYLLQDGTTGDFDTGLEFAGGRPKPEVFDSFRIPLWLPVTRASRGHALEVWGCARPAVGSFGHPTGYSAVAIQFAASTGRFHTVRTAHLTGRGGCYFDVRVAFAGSGTVRLAWSGPTGVEYSRTQPIRIS